MKSRTWAASFLIPPLLYILLTFSSAATIDAATAGNTLLGSIIEEEAFNLFGGGEEDADTNDLTNNLPSEDEQKSHRELRELLNVCKGPKEIHYFEVFIRLEPSGEIDVCNIADQVFLGNDLNQLLLNHGIGDAGANDDAIFLAGVCTQPSIDRRRELMRKTNGFIWKGGGGCRYCVQDDQDRRGLRSLQTGNWFTDTFAPQMSATLEAAILDTIVPNHPACLGLSPVVDVEIVQVTIEDLNLKCGADGEIIESLESLSLGDTPLKTKNDCGRCVSLDFSRFRNRMGVEKEFKKGDYVKREFYKQYGLKIFAQGGYSPTFAARIFDTGDAICVNADGSQEFGSPNKQCEGGGLGVGTGGESGELGENCKPVGNVLIVQESNKDCPDSNPSGGILIFQWDEPVLLSDIGLMDVDEDDQRIKIHYADEFFETFTYQGFGDNAVQRVVASKRNVAKVEVIFPGTGAVTEINFCPPCRPLITHDASHHCIFTQDQSLIKSQEVVYYNNFEKTGSEAGWSNAITDQSATFTRFLGRYARVAPAPYTIFTVDPLAAGIVFDIDFYEIDAWDSDDAAFIYVGGEGVDLGKFNYLQDERHRGGTTAMGIVWTLDSIDRPGRYGGQSGYLDQRHRVKVTVPKTSGLYHDGSLRLTLSAQVKHGKKIVSAGWDNVKVTVIHACH